MAAVAGWGALNAGTATPARAAVCGTTTGVTVVVDYGGLGGGVRTGCAAAPSSGLTALTGAGHSYTFVPRQAGMVCTIDRRPDPCNGAPVTAYWSYWHASPGGSWSYSTVGAGSHRPRAGSVEGWAYGAGRPPSIRPPTAPKPKTSTKPTSKPTTRVTTGTASPRASTPAPRGSAAARSGSVSAPGSTASTRPSGAAPTSSPSTTTGAAVPDLSSGATASPESASPSGPAADNVMRAADTKGTGDARTLVLGAILIAAIGGGAGAIAWQRRARR